MDDLLTIPEVAKYLKMSKTKVYELVQQKQIPHIKLGRNVRVRRGDLENWLNEHYVPIEYLQISTDHPPFKFPDNVEFVPSLVSSSN